MFLDQQGIFYGIHAADVAAVYIGAFGAGADTLEKGHGFGNLLIRRPDQAPSGRPAGIDQALKFQTGNDIGKLAVSEFGQTVWDHRHPHRWPR